LPLEHEVAQLPQYVEFDVVSTQVPLQRVEVDPEQPVPHE
jgi:hypothetical protein